MPWIAFLLALGCFAIATRTQSIGLALICLLLALGLILFGALSLVSARIQSRTQGPMAMNPVLEKHRLQGQTAATSPAPTSAATPRKGEAEDGPGQSDLDASGDGGGD